MTLRSQLSQKQEQTDLHPAFGCGDYVIVINAEKVEVTARRKRKDLQETYRISRVVSSNFRADDGKASTEVVKDTLLRA